MSLLSHFVEVTTAKFTVMAMRGHGGKGPGLTRRRRLALCGLKRIRNRSIQRSYELMLQILSRSAGVSGRVSSVSGGPAASKQSAT
jgi:hypothetical protein